MHTHTHTHITFINLHYSQPAYLHSILCFHTPARSLRPPVPICSPFCSHTQHSALVASLSHLLKLGTLCLQLCTPATVPTLSTGTLRLITSSNLFITPGTSLLAPEIWHLLALCALINVIYLFTCLLTNTQILKHIQTNTQSHTRSHIQCDTGDVNNAWSVMMMLAAVKWPFNNLKVHSTQNQL